MNNQLILIDKPNVYGYVRVAVFPDHDIHTDAIERYVTDASIDEIKEQYKNANIITI